MSPGRIMATASSQGRAGSRPWAAAVAARASRRCAAAARNGAASRNGLIGRTRSGSGRHSASTGLSEMTAAAHSSAATVARWPRAQGPFARFSASEASASR